MALDGRIIDAHLHLQSKELSGKLLRAMDIAGVSRAALLGSPRYTITLNPAHGFTNYLQNNTEIIETARRHPDRFCAWPTLNPLDGAINVERVLRYLDDGASGIKLYVGHADRTGQNPAYVFHVCDIDSPLLTPIYVLCSERRVPICLHVNSTAGAPGFAEQFERVLIAHPHLRVIAPHWLLATKRLTYLESMLARHSNLYIDTSFGRDHLLRVGFETISTHCARFRALLSRYANRLLLGSDLVCTSASHKTVDWIVLRLQAYICLVSAAQFETPVLPGKVINGLNLKHETLRNVLYANFERLWQRDA